MPEVRRGSRSLDWHARPLQTVASSSGHDHASPEASEPPANDAAPHDTTTGCATGSSGSHIHNPNTTTVSPPVPDPSLQSPRRSVSGRKMPSSPPTHDPPRRSLSYALRPPAPAYYDSRAATRTEYARRGRTLQEYYDANPLLLPQLPFTWHHGRRRWRLFLFGFLVFVDASVVPIALYYALHYAGHVEGWIIFAVVTTIWGGPTYLEFAVRTLRLMKEERFYRPLGTESRWCFDMLTWTSVVTMTAVTALFVVGSAPHVVWLRVLCMPAPAILYCLGGVTALLMLWHGMGWGAPFRISSTAKGGKVLPAAYYFMEDVIAVNVKAGRPYREALAARFKASRRFRRMLYVQSMFWCVPALVLAAALTVVAVVHDVPATAAYGICWAVPFIWCAVWVSISVWWCKRDMVRERIEWEQSCGTGTGTGTGTVEKQTPQGTESDCGSGLVVGRPADAAAR
ncbi:uncharacterized protein MAM_02708 [Metarhizium album ARSEF 1941]|uniref:Uncharacterized protein n=1 Tax=Metarhizium album (strain ARSEF 1941) TaxID=1081103 RepID=A0A0B2X1N7_METAS|nr:uncharacterized protein MAM_02708 [Metarhizium album ARSEF 1941]KHN99010.1 hypothetical protein MAM_02708 [Metarhizium album ARSEF 1941]